MRIVAGLRDEGRSDDEIVELVRTENLFQYPSTKMLANRALVCLRRFDALVPDDLELVRRGVTCEEARAAADRLVSLIAHGMPDQASQAILYSMMCRYDLVRDFIVDEVGERLRTFSYVLSEVDLGAFVGRFQLKYPDAASWSEATVYRLKSTLRQCLTQSGLRPDRRSEDLMPLMLDFEVEAAILALGDHAAVEALSGQVVTR